METPGSAPFQLAVRANDAGAVVITLAGDFDTSGVEQFRSCVDEFVDSSIGGLLIVDLGDVTFIDSSGISALLEARRLVTREHRELRLEHLSAPASRLSELTGLIDVLDSSGS